MKILAFTDIHESLSCRKKVEALIKKERPEVAVCAGDFTVFEQHLDQMMDWMQKLPVPVLLIHGNHEEEAVIRKMCTHRSNVTFIHKKPTTINGVTFIGWGGGGFDVKDINFDYYSREIEPLAKKAQKIVFVTHGPPNHSKLDYLYKEHVGNRSYENFIRKHDNVVLAISGHLHENFEKEDHLHRTKLINPGPNGKIINI
jgi:Icc-related predicted phosphoesterase